MLKIHTHRSLGASEFKSSLKYEAANVEKKKKIKEIVQLVKRAEEKKQLSLGNLLKRLL